MAKIIPLRIIPPIVDFFINTPVLHNFVFSILSEEQEIMWENNEDGDRQAIPTIPSW